jgi:fatty-acyl-CoA synthase
MMRAVKPDSSRTITDIVEDFARSKPQNSAILFEDRTITYSELDAGANRYAHWAHTQGIGRGDAVVLLMENRPEYLMAWMGLARLGAVAALINTNLRGQPLAHTLEIASARHAIVGHELAENFLDAVVQLPRPLLAWSTGGASPRMEKSGCRPVHRTGRSA